MRMTLRQLREMVSAVVGGGSGWVPSARDIDMSTVVFAWDDNRHSIGYDEDTQTVSFEMHGPWERGPLIIDNLSLTHIMGAFDVGPTNTDFDLSWSAPPGPANWEELGMTFEQLRDAMDDAGIFEMSMDEYPGGRLK
jgi:hypothetical protein